MRKITLFLILTPILLAGCAGTEIPTDAPLPTIYETAYKQLNDKNYARAAETFQEAEKTFPSSEWSSDALVMAAYSAYMDGDFTNSLIITDRFMRFHPGSDAVPYIMYLRGMCYYRQVSDVRREPGMSIYALNAFETLKKRFPNSDYAKNVDNKILILKNYVAGKVMYSARRDMDRENWTSAIEQLQQIVMTAQETQMTPEALFRLHESYTAIGLPSQAAGYADMLRTNFQDSDWAKKLK